VEDVDAAFDVCGGGRGELRVRIGRSESSEKKYPSILNGLCRAGQTQLHGRTYGKESENLPPKERTRTHGEVVLVVEVCREREPTT